MYSAVQIARNCVVGFAGTLMKGIKTVKSVETICVNLLLPPRRKRLRPRNKISLISKYDLIIKHEIKKKKNNKKNRVIGLRSLIYCEYVIK